MTGLSYHLAWICVALPMLACAVPALLIAATEWAWRRIRPRKPTHAPSWALHLTTEDHDERDQLDAWLDARWHDLTEGSTDR